MNATEGKPLQDAIERAKKIKIILFDVDGVLTDGTIWVVPAASQDHRDQSKAGVRPGPRLVEAKGFHAHDGIGISLARLAGLTCGLVTKRVSEAVAGRARDLKIEHLYMGQSYKMRAVREIMQETGAAIDEIAFVGDDIVDLPVMRECGLAIAPPNARAEVKAAAHYVTQHAGGAGAGRDAVDFVLSAKGVLERVIEEYLDEANPTAAATDIGKGRM